jgi:hypothetical protein
LSFGFSIGHEKPIALGSPKLRVELPEAPEIGALGGRQDSVPHQLGDQSGNRFIPCAWIGIGIYGLTFSVSTTHGVLTQ